LTILIGAAGFGLSAIAAAAGQTGVGLALGGLTYVAVIVVVGIVAAIAVPAYQDYAERARQVQSQQ
jgi:hypothetical protein